MSHGDRVIDMPEGFKLIASTDNAPIAGIADENRGYYAIQFHPEVTHTRQGQRILSRFVHEICGCAALWTPGNIIEDSIKTIRDQVGEDQVLLGLSGGVDSSVAAALLCKQDYEVCGITMEIYDGSAHLDGSAKHACYGPGEKEDIESAAAICEKLKIPF